MTLWSNRSASMRTTGFRIGVEGEMIVAKPTGQRGSWFAVWKGESLPCVHACWVPPARGKMTYLDPHVGDDPKRLKVLELHAERLEADSGWLSQNPVLDLADPRLGFHNGLHSATRLASAGRSRR